MSFECQLGNLGIWHPLNFLKFEAKRALGKMNVPWNWTVENEQQFKFDITQPL